jgi:streptomycin 6-kinase
MEALQIFGGRGINRLVDLDKELNAVLLERIQPGTMLVQEPNVRKRIDVACKVMEQLHSAVVPRRHGLPHVMDWLQGAFRDARRCSDPVRSRPYVEQIPKIERVMARFMDESEPQVLLHGDLHHFNILLDENRGWIAIDPKGVIGARCLDIGRFIGNIIDDEISVEERKRDLVAAIQAFSENLGESPERVYAGAFCDRIMSSSWELAREPHPDEELFRETLGVWIDVGKELDVDRL